MNFHFCYMSDYLKSYFFLIFLESIFIFNSTFTRYFILFMLIILFSSCAVSPIT